MLKGNSQFKVPLNVEIEYVEDEVLKKILSSLNTKGDEKKILEFSSFSIGLTSKWMADS